MSKKTNGVNYSKSDQVIERRKRVIKRLEDQLVSGVKNTGKTTIELEQFEINRINKEIETLKTRI